MGEVSLSAARRRQCKANSDIKEGGRVRDSDAKAELLNRARDDGGRTGTLAAVEGGDINAGSIWGRKSRSPGERVDVWQGLVIGMRVHVSRWRLVQDIPAKGKRAQAKRSATVTCTNAMIIRDHTLQGRVKG